MLQSVYESWSINVSKLFYYYIFTFFQHCGKVLGLELVAEAVKDAKANAELNNIENCQFFTGKAEDILPTVLARANEENVVAIVDPPRAGLRKYISYL